MYSLFLQVTLVLKYKKQHFLQDMKCAIFGFLVVTILVSSGKCRPLDDDLDDVNLKSEESNYGEKITKPDQVPLTFQNGMVRKKV